MNIAVHVQLEASGLRLDGLKLVGLIETSRKPEHRSRCEAMRLRSEIERGADCRLSQGAFWGEGARSRESKCFLLQNDRLMRGQKESPVNRETDRA